MSHLKQITIPEKAPRRTGVVESDLRDKTVRQKYADAAAETGVATASLAMGVLNGTPYSSSPDAGWVLDHMYQNVSKPLRRNNSLLSA